MPIPGCGAPGIGEVSSHPVVIGLSHCLRVETAILFEARHRREKEAWKAGSIRVSLTDNLGFHLRFNPVSILAMIALSFSLFFSLYSFP